MGHQRRYKVPFFDHQFRVALAAETSDEKDVVIFGSAKIDEAQGAYDRAVAENPGCTVYLLDRARIMRRSDR